MLRFTCQKYKKKKKINDPWAGGVAQAVRLPVYQA
jgi:hypothetical protein